MIPSVDLQSQSHICDVDEPSKMCRFCEKLDAFESIHTTAIDSIHRTLGTLYKNVDPHLPALWAWRYNETVKLQEALEALQRLVQMPGLEELAKDIGDEIQSIRKEIKAHVADVEAMMKEDGFKRVEENHDMKEVGDRGTITTNSVGVRVEQKIQQEMRIEEITKLGTEKELVLVKEIPLRSHSPGADSAIALQIEPDSPTKHYEEDLDQKLTIDSFTERLSRRERSIQIPERTSSRGKTCIHDQNDKTQQKGSEGEISPHSSEITLLPAVQVLRSPKENNSLTIVYNTPRSSRRQIPVESTIDSSSSDFSVRSPTLRKELRKVSDFRALRTPLCRNISSCTSGKLISEASRRERERSASKITTPSVGTSSKKDLPEDREKPSEDVDAAVLIAQSAGMVVAWMDQCEAAVADIGYRWEMNASTVSVEGDKAVRPRLDIPVWSSMMKRKHRDVIKILASTPAIEEQPDPQRHNTNTASPPDNQQYRSDAEEQSTNFDDDEMSVTSKLKQFIQEGRREIFENWNGFESRLDMKKDGRTSRTDRESRKLSHGSIQSPRSSIAEMKLRQSITNNSQITLPNIGSVIALSNTLKEEVKLLSRINSMNIDTSVTTHLPASPVEQLKSEREQDQPEEKKDVGPGVHFAEVDLRERRRRRSSSARVPMGEKYQREQRARLWGQRT